MLFTHFGKSEKCVNEVREVNSYRFFIFRLKLAGFSESQSQPSDRKPDFGVVQCSHLR
jgi:hypothetical protein